MKQLVLVLGSDMLIISYFENTLLWLDRDLPLLPRAVAFTVQADEDPIARKPAANLSRTKEVACAFGHTHDPELCASIPSADLSFGKPGKSDPAITQRDALAAPEDHTEFGRRQIGQ